MAEILKKKVAYTCPIFRVEERDMHIADGASQVHWVVVRNPYVGVIALTEDKQLVLIEELRVDFNFAQLDIPAGKYDHEIVQEDKLLAQAKLELKEETGYEAGQLEQLDLQITRENWYERDFYYYAAWELRYTGFVKQPGEIIDVKLMDVSEVEELIRQSKLPPYLIKSLTKALQFFKHKQLI